MRLVTRFLVGIIFVLIAKLIKTKLHQTEDISFNRGFATGNISPTIIKAFNYIDRRG